MNLQEQNLIEQLKDLKENYSVISVKAEFGTEGTRLEEAYRLKELTSKSGLDFTIKIGGCEAVRDLCDAKNIGVNTIIAPMIESSYALQKYAESLLNVFNTQELENINIYINIETQNGINNLNPILHSEYAKIISGIILGRTDLVCSMGLDKNYVNNEEIYNIAECVAKKAAECKKDFLVGGGLSEYSIPFLTKLNNKNYISKFETRKIVFDKNILLNQNVQHGINKAIEFELLWIKNRRENYNIVNNNDNIRIKKLETLVNKSVKL